MQGGGEQGTSPLVSAYEQFLAGVAFLAGGLCALPGFPRRPAAPTLDSLARGLRNCEQHACDANAQELAAQSLNCAFASSSSTASGTNCASYANERGILLFGDMPIYVHQESADVWAHQALFDLDEQGQPVTVTGVPPDYFSAEGQLWGNPQYNWAQHADGGFQWWLQRFDSAARQFDIARIDHFRALEAYWEIPASATSAKEGKWVHAPGRELLQAVR